MSSHWEIRAFKYAERPQRTRADSFLFDDDHASPHDIDYFVWVLSNGHRNIVVDTGYDREEAVRRDRPILRDPADALGLWGIDPADIEDVIITHLHYDHGGGLDRFPNAKFHLQAAEMAYATGPCMCHGALQHPFSVGHVVQAVEHVFAGRVQFYEGTGRVAPGVTVHRIGGHTRGLQAVRVETAQGPLVLASDATHYWENMMTGKLFPIVVDAEDMVRGFDTLLALAGSPERVIPGHDPLVRQMFPLEERGEDVYRLDVAPLCRLTSKGQLEGP